MRMLGGSLSICLLLVAATGGVNPKLLAAERPQQGWYDNFEKARDAAKTIDRPLLIHFHANWCGACQAMEQSVLNTNPVVQQLGSRVIGVKINSDTRPDLIAKYGVGGLPSDVFVSPEGQILTRGTASWEPEGYKKEILLVSNRFVASKLHVLFASIRQADSKASNDTPSGADATPAVALKGYSPVSIIDQQKWNHGSPEFAFTHGGVVYQMASAEELEKFKKSPARYTPGWLGRDPLEVISSLESVIGDIRFGAFYRQKLYLLSSEENRRNFLANPEAYEDVGG